MELSLFPVREPLCGERWPFESSAFESLALRIKED